MPYDEVLYINGNSTATAKFRGSARNSTARGKLWVGPKDKMRHQNIWHSDVRNAVGVCETRKRDTAVCGKKRRGNAHFNAISHRLRTWLMAKPAQATTWQLR